MDINGYAYTPHMLDAGDESMQDIETCLACPYFEDCTGLLCDCAEWRRTSI